MSYVYSARTRQRLRAGMLALTVLGLAVLGFGLAASRPPTGTSPRPVTYGRPAPLPDTGLFGGPLALYGAPGAAATPEVEQLGCRLTGSGSVSGRGTDELDRRVVGEQALLPLARIWSAPAGSSIVCDGPAAMSLQPLFLIVGPGNRDLVPMAAFSLATVALAIGVAGVVTLRPKE